LSAALPGPAVTDGKPEGVADGLPPELSALLRAQDDASRDRAWERFLDKYSRLLLHTVRSRSGSYDEAMERYVFVLERLRVEEFERLRRYTPEVAARFTTWLVVVTGRLCIDHFRKRYGCSSQASVAEDEALRHRLEARRRLADLVSEKLDVSSLGDPAQDGPEIELRQVQLEEALVAAIESLEPQDRLLVKLRFYKGLTAKEVAASMGLPSQFHVYRRLKRVTRELRERLSERGIGTPRA
jgi:RNA polymerase sigma factor (sigma-70 family)